MELAENGLSGTSAKSEINASPASPWPLTAREGEKEKVLTQHVTTLQRHRENRGAYYVRVFAKPKPKHFLNKKLLSGFLLSLSLSNFWIRNFCQDFFLSLSLSNMWKEIHLHVERYLFSHINPLYEVPLKPSSAKTSSANSRVCCGVCEPDLWLSASSTFG